MKMKKSIIILCFFTLFVNIVNSKPFNKINLNIKNSIVNTTNKTYLDTILHIGLEIENIDSVIIIIKPLTSKIKNSIKNLNISCVLYYENKSCFLYVDDCLMYNTLTIKLMAHELIHLKQYYKNELIFDNNNIVYYKNIQYSLSKINYFEYPWEMDAFNEQADLYKKIKNILQATTR